MRGSAQVQQRARPKRAGWKPRAERRREILLVAARLFREKGYRSTSLNDVAEAIGFTKPAIFYHFDAKEDLLFEMHNQLVRDSRERVEQIVRLTLPPVEKMRRILTQHIETLLENLDLNVVFNREFGFLSPEREKTVRQIEREHDLLIRQVYAEGVAAGEFLNIDPTVAVSILLGACNMTYRWYRPRGHVTPSEIVETIATLLQGGYLA